MKKILKNTVCGTLFPFFWCVLQYNNNHGYFAESYGLLISLYGILFAVHAGFSLLHIPYIITWSLWLVLLLPSLNLFLWIDILYRVALFFCACIGYRKIPLKPLSLLVTILLFLNVFQVVQRDYRARQQAAHLLKDKSITSNVSCEKNIYWIVCDAYTSGSILQKYYDFDNLPFYRQLEDLGFKIPDKRISNCHPIAHYSTLKAINTYLNFGIFSAAQQAPLTLHYTLKRNRFCGQLFQHGYQLYSLVSRATFLHNLNCLEPVGPKASTTFEYFLYVCFRQNQGLGRFFGLC